MKSIPIYQVDAFSKKVFSGNPAAVCILDNWLSDRVLQDIASENNLSETAFINIGEVILDQRVVLVADIEQNVITAQPFHFKINGSSNDVPRR